VNDHLEETVSTLDYACKAKSIVNRPEISDREWGKVSISDYVERIERLRADLKVGVTLYCIADNKYFPED
jgi:kinesin family protein 11